LSLLRSTCIGLYAAILMFQVLHHIQYQSINGSESSGKIQNHSYGNDIYCNCVWRSGDYASW